MKRAINYSAITRMMGVLFLVLGIALAPPLLVALLYREGREALCFLMVSVPCLLAGILLLRLFNPRDLRAKQREGYFIVTLFWLIGSVVGALPLIASGALPNPFDAFFEICSGFSTTGSTVMNHIEDQARSILFWRSFTHWLGGMGIVCFAAAFMPSIGIGAQTVASAETPGPTLSKLTARFSDSVRNLYKLYIAFTLILTGLLMLGGMSLYDALIHTFGTVGTGGFSNYSDSIAHFQSPYIEWVLILFMILCGINFNLYFYLSAGRSKKFFQDEELRLYLGIIATFSLLIALTLYRREGYPSVGEAVRDAAFHVSSLITTTGYVTRDYDLWPAFCKVLLILVMVSGASSSSTGGGIKVVRLLAAVKYMRRSILLRLYPNRLADIKMNGTNIPNSVVTGIINFLFFYILLLLTGTLLVSGDGFSLTTNLTACLTCLSNVGPGLGRVGPTMNFADFSNFSKLVLALLMLAGRLEIYTFFIGFSRHFWDSNRA